MKFINKSNLKFINISSEKYRIYMLPNGKKLKIKYPLYLHVSKSGGHRVFDNKNNCYYIKPSESWFIKWKVKDGESNFVV